MEDSGKLVLSQRDLVVIGLAKLFFPHKFSYAFSPMQVEWIGSFFFGRVCMEAPPYFGKTKIMSFLKNILSSVGIIDFLKGIDFGAYDGDLEKVLAKANDFCKVGFRGRKMFMGSETAELAEEILGDIKEEFESNQLLRSVFGDLVGKDTWTKDHLKLPNGSEIISKGRGYQWRGFHPDDATLDDIQTDENASRDQFDKDWKWFNRQILSRRPANLHIIGNRLTDYSIVARITDNYHNQYSKWVAKKYVAVDSTGLSTWKSGVPQGEIEALKENMGPTLFAMEYMGQTSADQDIDALRSRLQFYSALPKDTDFINILSIDEAFTQDPYKISSSTGMAILEYARRGMFSSRAFLTRIEKQKLLIDGVADWMVELQKQHKFSFIGLQDTVGGKGLKALFLEKCRNLRIPVTFGFIDLPATKSKQARLRDVLPLIENGSVLFDATNSSQKEWIEDELLPRGIGNNDRLDAFVNTLVIMRDYIRGGRLYRTDQDVDGFGDQIKSQFKCDKYTGRPI